MEVQLRAHSSPKPPLPTIEPWPPIPFGSLQKAEFQFGWSYLFIFGCQAVENVYYLEKKQRAESFVEMEHQAYKPINIEL